MLKRKYQSGGKPNPKKMNVESGNLSGSDTGNLAYDEGIFVKDEKSGKYLETSKEDVERLIGEGKIDPRNTDQIKYGINNLKRDNAVTKEDRTDFDRFKTSNKLGFNYNESGQLVDRMGRAVDEDYMSNMSNTDKRQLGKSYKQAEMNEKTGAGKLIHSLFGSKKKALERGLEGTGDIYGSASNRLAFQVPNYKKEETTSTQEPITPETPSTTTLNQPKNQQWKEFKGKAGDPYTYRVLLDEQGNAGAYSYKKGNEDWTDAVDKREAAISQLYHGYKQNPSGFTGLSGRNRVTSVGGSGTGRNQPVNTGTSNQPANQQQTPIKPQYGDFANNTLSPEYIAQHGFTGDGGRGATNPNQPYGMDLGMNTAMALGTAIGGSYALPYAKRLLTRYSPVGKFKNLAGQAQEYVQSKYNSVMGKNKTINEVPAAQQTATEKVNIPSQKQRAERPTGNRLTRAEKKNEMKSAKEQPQAETKQESKIETPFVQTESKNVPLVSSFKDINFGGTKYKDLNPEDKAHELDVLGKTLQGKGDDFESEGYQKQFIQELKKTNPKIVAQLRDAYGTPEYSKLIQQLFKQGGIVKFQKGGIKEAIKKGVKEKATDIGIGAVLDSKKAERDWDWIDSVSLGASFVPGLNVASSAFDAGRNLYDEYKAGDLDSKDFMREGLDFATNLIPGAKAAKKAYKLTRAVANPKVAKAIGGATRLVFTNEKGGKI